jgi:hypothetical protein
MDRELEKLVKKYANAKTARERKDALRALELYKSVKGASDLGSTTAGGESDKFITKVLPDSIKNIYEQMKKYGGSVADVLGPLERLQQGQKQFVQATDQFFKAGYTGQMFDFADAISTASKASLELNGNLRGAQEVMRGFQQRSMTLALANEQFTKTLMNSAVVLERAGFEMDTFADIVDSAAFAFNKNEEEISGLTATLINVQKQIPVSGRNLAENFRFAQREFAYQSGRMMDNFVGLQKMSVTTGIEFTDLARSFGDSMDSFQGSAQMAGSLNQILGKSVFNSIELLNMTETERATKVRNAILQSGRSVEDMGKFELKALSKTLGFSVEDTRKFLRGDLKIDEADALKAIRSQNPSKMIMDNSKDLSKELDFLRDRIKSVRPSIDNLRIGFNDLLDSEGLKMLDKIFGKVANVEGLGLTREQTIEQLARRVTLTPTTGNRAAGGGTLGGLGGENESQITESARKLVEKMKKTYEEALTDSLTGQATDVGQVVNSLNSLTDKIGEMLTKLPTIIASALE